jgi:hypothetical protein
MLYYNHPIEVSLDETRQMATVSPPDIVGFVKYSTLYDYKTVRNPPSPPPNAHFIYS